jgi:hypothetical protein
MKLGSMLGALILALQCCGCGAVVPEIGEIWDNNSGVPADKTLEMLIKKKVFCELQRAVSDIQAEPGFTVIYNGKKIAKKYIPETWGVLMTLQITVDESTQTNPGVTLTDPLAPVKSFGSSVSQSFKTSIGGTFSTEANRQDKFTYYYLVKDLEGSQPACDYPPEYGSSFLLDDNLEIEKWLRNAMNMRISLETSEVSQQEVATYDIKFIVTTNVGATPTWTLLRVTASSGNGNLLGLNRNRTHELILTFGPTQSGPGGKAQPSLIASNDALAQQIGAAVANAISKSGVIVPTVIVPTP